MILQLAYRYFFKLLLGNALFLASALSLAQEMPARPCPDNTIPRFEDYAVKPESVTRRAKLKLNNEFSRMFRTRLREGLRNDPIELAGHYVVVTFGCGSSCIYGGFVDAITGQATALPFALNSIFLFGADDPLLIRADSRLVIMQGTINEAEGPPMVAYYEWTGTQLKPICQRPLPDQTEEAGSPK
ncbi:MAG: hypothetical protein K9J42_07880 [Sulfuritalea sp.]|nr:hypothetical protein [Sulfuritalea sp.]